MDQISKNDLDNLADQFRRGRPILFTGAGFSLGVKNTSGTQIPSYKDVKEHIWNLCFPGTPVDEESTIQDLYDAALARRKDALTSYLKNSLTVDSESIPEWYAGMFSLPWYKAYTLNIDDLEVAVARKHSLFRKIKAISGTSDKVVPEIELAGAETLKVIHLNGTISDIPENSTFSTTQYAHRLSRQDPWYQTLSNELLVYPVIFIGTKLNEPPLWQHLELRKKKQEREGA